MKKILCLITCLSFFSCSDDDFQGCTNAESKTWFNEFKAEIDEDCSIEVSIFKGNYNGETVYYQLITDPRVNFQAMLEFYNCDGEVVANLTAEESNEYLNDQADKDEKIYTCSE
ncbi:hypothetical protein G3I01_10775 [Gramella sp. MT6]|uniref:hypothetical protein n=1 Tax=Gramella sp. MT6 TaxID=2705471 RepID=UPI001C5F2BFF|nr:hypothetical protein [Gramella sp. MT6]QYA25976.1 hypothetical protein G3I01_10775 [Gramella sp. MT6]